VQQWEPVTDYVGKLFSNYRDIWYKVVKHIKDAAQKRVDLANRWRRPKELVPGMKVLIRDPRHKQAGGRGPYRQPPESGVIADSPAPRGNKCAVRRPDGVLLKDVHAENILLLPDASHDLESKEPWQAEDDDAVLDVDCRRSPGQMIEDDGQQVADRLAADTTKPGKLSRIFPNTYIAYKSLRPNKADIFKRLCEVGRVLNVSKVESSVVVHVHKPLSEGRLRVKWIPVYVVEGSEVLGSGTEALTVQVEAQRILFPVQLHDGVLSHAAARRLDNGDYGFYPEEKETYGIREAIGADSSSGVQIPAASGGSSPGR